MHPVYFDFEFTNLERDSEPMSIGLVAQSGRTFYAECDDYDAERVSGFTHEVVMPLMALKLVPLDAQGSKRAVGQALLNWLLDLPGPAHLHCDSTWDIHQLRALQSAYSHPDWPSAEVVRINGNSLGESIRDSFFAVPRHYRHHALHDAMALREAYEYVRQTNMVVESPFPA